jgi:hypothetical protein
VRDQIDQCSWLRLREICEPEDNYLRLVLEEMVTGDAAEELLIGDVSLGPTHKVEHTEACRVFEVIWETYIAYGVVNESYGDADRGDVYEGRRFRCYAKSQFLEYVRRNTWGDDQYPGPSKHVAIVCEHHIVNVVSVSEPQLRLLKPGQPRGVPDA